jgi:hypothetical protein
MRRGRACCALGWECGTKPIGLVSRWRRAVSAVSSRLSIKRSICTVIQGVSAASKRLTRRRPFRLHGAGLKTIDPVAPSELIMTHGGAEGGVGGGRFSAVKRRFAGSCLKLKSTVNGRGDYFYCVIRPGELLSRLFSTVGPLAKAHSI